MTTKLRSLITLVCESLKYRQQKDEELPEHCSSETLEQHLEEGMQFSEKSAHTTNSPGFKDDLHWSIKLLCCVVINEWDRSASSVLQNDSTKS